MHCSYAYFKSGTQLTPCIKSPYQYIAVGVIRDLRFQKDPAESWLTYFNCPKCAFIVFRF